MIIEEILAEIAARKSPLPPEAFPKYHDVVMQAGKHNPFTIYPDKSRSIDDIISVLGMITIEGSPLLSILGSFLLHRQAGGVQVYFEDGLCTHPHTHNYAELGYVAEGQYHAHIEGRDYLFNKGELFLINKNIPHNECLYRKNSAVLFLSIGNSFFDKSMRHEVYDRKTENFIKCFVMNGGGAAIISYALFPKKKTALPPVFLKKFWQRYCGPIRGRRILSSAMWNGYLTCFRRNMKSRWNGITGTLPVICFLKRSGALSKAAVRT